MTPRRKSPAGGKADRPRGPRPAAAPQESATAESVSRGPAPGSASGGAAGTATARRSRSQPGAQPSAQFGTESCAQSGAQSGARQAATSRTRRTPAPARTAPERPATRAAHRAAAAARTAEAAFDALYARAATALLRQVELLTGDSAFAGRAVAHAFDQAWQRWPEVARDADPMGWVRAAAHEYALAPRHNRLPGRRAHPHRRPRTPGSSLEAALLDLPPAQRRAVLLHDGLGLALPEAAVETEASTAATAARITRARETLTAALPELADRADRAGRAGLEDRENRENREDDGGLPARLGALLGSGLDREPPREPAGVRDASERGVRRRTLGSFALTALIAVAAVLTVLAGPGGGSGPGQHNGVEPSPAGDRSHAAGP